MNSEVCFLLGGKRKESASAAQLRRRHSHSLFELPPEAGCIDIAHSQADIIYGHIRGKQQLLRLFQAQRPHIVGKILPHLFFEQIAHVCDAHMEDIRQIGNGKIRGGEILLHQLANLRGIDDLIFGFGLEKAQKLSDMGLDFRLFFPVGEAAAEIQGLKIKLAVVEILVEESCRRVQYFKVLFEKCVSGLAKYRKD